MNSLQIKSTFGFRLIESLTFQGITERNAQIERIAELANVTPVTAAKYLQSESPPASRKRPSIFSDIAKGLDCDWNWLYDGSGYCPYQLAMAKNMSTMTDWQKNKVVRMCLRLLNRDAKVQKNIELFHSGFISYTQLLSAM